MYIYKILGGVCVRAHAPDLTTDGCKPPCSCWELNSGPLEEQPGLLTSEPSLQPLVYCMHACIYVCIYTMYIYVCIYTMCIHYKWIAEGGLLELAVVDQAGLKLTEIRLPLPLKCWD